MPETRSPDGLDLEALRALLKAATPGPWEHKHGVEVQDVNCTVLAITEGDRFDEADAALIVAAVNALPALLSRLERAEEENAQAAKHDEKVRGARTTGET